MFRVFLLSSILVSHTAFARQAPDFNCACGPFNNGGWKCDLIVRNGIESTILKTSFVGGAWGNDKLIQAFQARCEEDRRLTEKAVILLDSCRR